MMATKEGCYEALVGVAESPDPEVRESAVSALARSRFLKKIYPLWSRMFLDKFYPL
jgi:hypothetical protein